MIKLLRRYGADTATTGSSGKRLNKLFQWPAVVFCCSMNLWSIENQAGCINQIISFWFIVLLMLHLHQCVLLHVFGKQSLLNVLYRVAWYLRNMQNVHPHMNQMIFLSVLLSDCSYTCHYRCQPFIQLECNTDGKCLTEEEEASAESLERDTNVVRISCLHTHTHCALPWILQ